MNKIFALTLLLLSSASALAAVDEQFHLESYAQDRFLNQSGFSKHPAQYEGYLLTDYAWSWTGEEFFVEVKPQLRALQSPGVNGFGPGAATVAPSQRWLHSRRLIGRSADQEMYFDFDRLDLRYRVSDIELYAGRRPMSFGVLRLFPVWNKLTLPLIFRPGPEWIDNPDGVGGSMQMGQVQVRAMDIRGSSVSDEPIYLGEVKYSPGVVEVQGLLADWWKRTAGGAALSLDFLDATWRLEAIQFGAERGVASAVAQNQWGAGVERAFGSRWTVDVEYFQQSLCQTRGAYTLAPPSPLQVLNGCRYIFPYADLQIDRSWKAGSGVLFNLEDKSSVAILSADYIWSDNLSFELKAKWAIGGARTEFGESRYQDFFGNKAGAQSTVYVGLSYSRN